MLEFHVDGQPRRAPVWVPEGFDSGRSWPLLVFLHAYEERGDHAEHLDVGIGPALASNAELFPCVVVLPQCPRSHVWSVVDRPWAEGMEGAEAHIDAAIAAVLDRYPIDRERIALTGASMGGYGVFGYGAAHPNRFCAFGPICGGGDVARAAAFRDRPLWAVHGAADDVVPPSESRAMVDAIIEAGSTSAIYTELSDAGHDVWNDAYRHPPFVEFLLSGKLPG